MKFIIYVSSDRINSATIFVEDVVSVQIIKIYVLHVSRHSPRYFRL